MVLLPKGVHIHQTRPKGLYNSPDIFQEIMNEIFNDLEYVRAYIDYILIISNSNFEDHLNKVKL